MSFSEVIINFSCKIDNSNVDSFSQRLESLLPRVYFEKIKSVSKGKLNTIVKFKNLTVDEHTSIEFILY